MHAWPVQVTSAPQLSCLSRLTQLDFDLLWLDRQVKQNLLHMLCQLACGAGCLASRSCYSCLASCYGGWLRHQLQPLLPR